MENVFFKRVAIVAIAVLTMSLSVGAQPKKSDMDAGVNLLYGTTSGWSNIGFGAKFRYNVTDPIRLAAEFDYFLKKDYLSMWDFSVYGHYLFPIADKVVVYPEVGLGVVGSTVSLPSFDILGYGSVGGNSASRSDFAVSLGGGIDYQLTSNLVLNGNLRYKTISGSWFNIAIGIAYKF